MPEANGPLASEECGIVSLRFVSLRLLWDCNIRCVMCDHPWRPHREMSVETAHAVLDQLKHPVRLTFIGGEPCLWLRKHPGVFQRALNDGHVVHVVTNGMLVPKLPFLVDAFSEHAISVQFSIDGYGPGYEAIRRGARWESLVEAIRLLHGRRIAAGNTRAAIIANYVLLRQTLADLPRFIRFCAAEGIDTVYLTYGLIIDSMVERGTIAREDSVLFHREATDALLEAASKVAREVGMPLGLPPPLGDPEVLGRRWIGEPKVALPPGRSAVPKSGLACDKPWKEIFVNQDGAIVPCCCGPGMGPVIGNVADGLESVWNGTRVKEVRAALLGGGFDAGCRCGINMSSIGRRESSARFFVASAPLEAKK